MGRFSRRLLRGQKLGWGVRLRAGCSTGSVSIGGDGGGGNDTAVSQRTGTMKATWWLRSGRSGDEWR